MTRLIVFAFVIVDDPRPDPIVVHEDGSIAVFHSAPRPKLPQRPALRCLPGGKVAA